jgi:hypothetical protein
MTKTQSKCGKKISKLLFKKNNNNNNNRQKQISIIRIESDIVYGIR